MFQSYCLTAEGLVVCVLWWYHVDYQLNFSYKDMIFVSFFIFFLSLKNLSFKKAQKIFLMEHHYAILLF